MIVLNIFIYIIYLTSTILISTVNTEKWCTEIIPVRKTRAVIRHGSQMITRRNWLGMVKNEWKPHTYTDQENYYDFERKIKCCDGYESLIGDCKPICEPACPANSYCESPRICKCNSGYEGVTNLGSSIVCSPICASGCPIFSSCTAPNECTCFMGYGIQPNGACEPICSSGCPENSTCVAPEKCSCNEGYRTTANGTCEPICLHGCPSHGWCDAPNHCSCNDGYIMNAGKSCQPNCEAGCPAFSSCFAPAYCECQPGYRMNANATLCEPQCQNGCPQYSVCLRPNFCQCDDGYRMQKLSGSLSYCEPICEMDCSVYGKCVRPGVCECLPGYNKTLDGARNSVLCQPRCSKGCEHGFCFAPEICVCNSGYLMGPNSTCEPTCSLGCVNGKCVEPEICACAEGYSLQKGSVNVCEPICEPACEHADCVAPNICICWHRHQPADYSQTVCVPTCPWDCMHGHCNAAFECTCDEGYIPHSYLTNECVAHCENCENGDCFEPDECTCWPGYSFQRGEKEQCLWNSTEVLEPGADYTIESSEEDDNSSVTEMEEIAWMKIAPEGVTDDEFDSGTTTTDISTVATASTLEPADFMTEPLAGLLCVSQCKCWKEIDEYGAINTTICTKICIDGNDEGCLNVSRCHCDFHNQQLICNTTELEETLEYYKCYLHINGSASQIYSSSIIWWIVGAICAFLALGAVVLIWQSCIRNRDEEYNVVYQCGNEFVRT